jgi:AraC family transcriptional activator of pyochelin receptor
MELLCERPEYKWTLDLLSERVGLEVRKLTRLFRILYNKSVMQALMEERMKKALLLLRDSEVPLLKVARATGYRNHSNFSQAFRKFFGKTPSEVRSRIS